MLHLAQLSSRQQRVASVVGTVSRRACSREVVAAEWHKPCGILFGWHGSALVLLGALRLRECNFLLRVATILAIPPFRAADDFELALGHSRPPRHRQVANAVVRGIAQEE